MLVYRVILKIKVKIIIHSSGDASPWDSLVISCTTFLKSSCLEDCLIQIPVKSLWLYFMCKFNSLLGRKYSCTGKSFIKKPVLRNRAYLLILGDSVGQYQEELDTVLDFLKL